MSLKNNGNQKGSYPVDKEDRCYQFYYSLSDYPEIVYLRKLSYPAYDLDSDIIWMPYLDNQPFQQEWSTIFHELSHRQTFRYRGTGSILNLDDQNYLAFTELLAEVGASLLCREMGILNDTKDAHVELIKWWKSVLRDNTLLKHVVVVAIMIIGDLLQKKLYRLDVPQEIRTLFLGR